MNICCDCRVIEGIGSQKTLWYFPQPNIPNDSRLSSDFNSTRSLGTSKLKINPSHVTLPKAKLNLSHFRTRTGSTVDLSLPQKIQDQSTLSLQDIRQLKRKNCQYMQIIQEQLIPLKKDYCNLLLKYKNKSQLVNWMNNKLKQIEQNYQSKPSSLKVLKKLKKVKK